MSTSVSNDTETNDASTGSREVCDKAGNCATAGPIGGNKVDRRAPLISITTPLDGGRLGLGESVLADYACTEGDSGLSSCAGSVASGANVDTASVGQKTFTVKATDEVGNTTSKSHVYDLVYVFSGFFSPVDNLPTLNLVSAGRAVPVKFSLSRNQGLNIFADGYPKSQRISCAMSAPLDDIEQTVNATSNSLSYDTSTDQYSYVWKTDKAWTGICRQVILKLKDGTEHKANFRFK